MFCLEVSCLQRDWGAASLQLGHQQASFNTHNSYGVAMITDA